MKQPRIKPYLYLFFLLLFVLSFSKNFSDELRGGAVLAFVPSWGKSRGKGCGGCDKNRQLALENERLKTQIETLKEWVVSEGRKEEELKRLEMLMRMEEREEDGSFYKRRASELKQEMELQMEAVPAKVVVREPVSWCSSVWINVGTRDNEALGRVVVAEDSPVVVGSALVGVVEVVKPTKSRVRLVTDSGLVSSVRALRGGEQRRVFSEQLMALKSTLQVQKELEGGTEREIELLKLIERVERDEVASVKSAFLAKGELAGSGAPLWRSRGHLLKGVGFNYDFDDVEGCAQHLRHEEGVDPLLKVGDLLVTTGFDGVFPAGLHVGRVVEVGVLREGASSYELTAEPVVRNFDQLETVFVLPPLQRAMEVTP